MSLLICRFLLLLLSSLSGTSSNRTDSSTNGCPFTRVSGDGSDSCTKQRSSGCSANRTTPPLGRLLLRGLLSFRGVIPGLLNRPLMAFEFIFLLLFGTLAFCRVDHHSCIRNARKS
jgi:hypothetical protein